MTVPARILGRITTNAPNRNGRGGGTTILRSLRATGQPPQHRCSVPGRRDAQPGYAIAGGDLHQLQAISCRSLPLALAGAGLRDLQLRLISAKPYADQGLQYHELAGLPDPAARAALIEPATTLGVNYEENTARQVVIGAAGYPYFIQEYGPELWNHAGESPIDSDDLATARELVRDSLARSFFGTRFQTVTDAEQRYLAAMAAAGEPPHCVSDVASAYRARDHRGGSGRRDDLIQKGLVWNPRCGQVDFTVYLRENHPLESFE